MNLEHMLKDMFESEQTVCRFMEPMSRHTTFRIGGPAQVFVSPGGEADLAAALRFCREQNMEWRILGNGSNLLVSDKGLDGMVISMEENWAYSRVEKDVLWAGAGELLGKAARQALRSSLSGMEFASGIPGTVGGALVMNAGAYGSEIKDILLSARIMTDQGCVLELPAGDLELGYRTSCIPGNRYIVLEAVFKLTPGGQDAIEERMKALSARRREKQPLEYPSAGSTFKRPAGHYAGQLIEEAGLRGYRHGGAQVSEKHCGFVINRGNATAADVMDLCRHVKAAVKEKSGVELEMEVKRWGEF